MMKMSFALSSETRRSRNSSNDLRFSSRQYWPARTSHRYRPSSTKRVSRSASFRCSQAKISSILVSTKRARLGSSLGSMGGFSVRKLVKPTKVFGSRPPHQSGLDQFLSSQTQPYVGAAAARVLREADAAMRQKLSRLNPPDRVFDQLAEFLALLLSDRGVQVLHLDQSLADKDYQRDLGDAGDPGVADELGIESQQAIRFLRVAAGGG